METCGAHDVWISEFTSVVRLTSDFILDQWRLFDRAVSVDLSDLVHVSSEGVLDRWCAWYRQHWALVVRDLHITSKLIHTLFADDLAVKTLATHTSPK
jgi:hypothetical protein